LKKHCRDCKFYVPMGDMFSGDFCNKKVGEKDTPYQRINLIIGNYEITNKDNNCQYFLPSLWKRITSYFKKESKNG